MLNLYSKENFEDENFFMKGLDYDFVEFGGALAAHLTFKFNNETNKSLEINNLVNVFSLNRKVFFIVNDDNGKAFEPTKKRIETINKIENGSVFYRDSSYTTIEDLLPDDAIRNPKAKVNAAFKNLEHLKENSYTFDKFKEGTKKLIEKLCTFIINNN